MGRLWRRDIHTSTSALLNGGASGLQREPIQWAASLYYDGAPQINGISVQKQYLVPMGDDVIFGDYGADTPGAVMVQIHLCTPNIDPRWIPRTMTHTGL